MLAGVDDGSSFPASSEDLQKDVAAAESQRRLFETVLKKACPRPLIISRLKANDNTTGYGNCLCGDASLLSAFTIQASSWNKIVHIIGTNSFPEFPQL